MNTQSVILFISISFLLGGCFSNHDTTTENPGCGVVDTRPEHIKKPPPVFQAKCATCHMIEKNTTGPALHGIIDREPYVGWTQEFIRNQDSLIEANDSSTMAIMRWSPVRFEHNFKEITPQEMKELLDCFSQD